MSTEGHPLARKPAGTPRQRAALAAAGAIALIHTQALAQVELPLPPGQATAQPAAATTTAATASAANPLAALPPGTQAGPTIRRVAVGNAWLLEWVPPGQPSSAAADAALQAQASPMPLGIRLVAAQGGASMLVLDDAAPATGPAAALRTAPGPMLLRRPVADGPAVLELPQAAEPAAPRPPAGLREVVLRSAEAAARALADPEPLVIYRVAVPGQ